MRSLFAIIYILASASFVDGDPSKPLPHITVLDGSVDKSEIPLSRAIWTFINVLYNLERNGTGKGIMILEQSVGLTPDQAEEFLNFAQSAVNEYRRLGKAETDVLYETFCVGEEALLTDDTRLDIERTKASSSMRSMRQRLNHFRESRTRQIPFDVYPIVRDWVDENFRGKLRIHEFDRAMRFNQMRSEGKYGRSPTLRKLCEVGENSASIVERIN